MAITRLDAIAALVVIDLQKGVAGMPTVHPMGEVVAEPPGWRVRFANAVCRWCW